MSPVVEFAVALVLGLGSLGGGTQFPAPSDPEPDRREVPRGGDEGRSLSPGAGFTELAVELAARHQFRVLVLAPVAPAGGD